MGPFPSTSAGVNEWQDELKVSSPAVVEQQAVAAETDFKTWYKATFETTPEQRDFVDAIDDDLAQHWGASIAFFIRHGLPIELIKPETKPEVRAPKLVLSEEELRQIRPSRAGDAEEAAGFEGVLRFRITY